MTSNFVGRTDFYPRPPRGGRHYKNNRCICAVAFLSTPSARRATGREVEHTLRRVISIHALREEGDLCGVLGFHGLGISIHALREEGDWYRWATET